MKTLVKAIAARQHAVRRLKKYATPKNGYSGLGRRLAQCSSLRPCRSLACPICATLRQRKFVEAAQNLMRAYEIRKGTTDWSVLSIVPHPFGVGQRGERRNKGPREVKQELEIALRKAGIRTFFGALDFSHNEDHRPLNAVNGRCFDPHWSVHLYGFAPAQKITPVVDKALRSYFRATNLVPKPVKIVPFDGDIRAIQYAMKPNFARRVTVIGKSFDRKGNPRPSRNTRSRPLRPCQDARLRVVIDKMSVEDRLVLVGVRLVPMASRFRLALLP